jgi:hypothetical protein
LSGSQEKRDPDNKHGQKHEWNNYDAYTTTPSAFGPMEAIEDTAPFAIFQVLRFRFHTARAAAGPELQVNKANY